jgi:RNA polymerase-binding transcription factor DksA
MAKQTKNTVAKKPEPKKAVKSVSKTVTPKAKPAKKALVQKPVAKKPVAKKPATKKPVAPKAKTVKAPAPKKPVKMAVKTAPKKSEAAKAAASRLLTKTRFSKDDLKDFLRELLSMRDRINSQSGAMKSAALQRNDEVNLEEEGTDAFMRLQTLEQVGTQQGVVIKINEALDAIAKGMYGVCDNCNELITKARLAVLPFARTCIKCQAELEKADRHGRRR